MKTLKDISVFANEYQQANPDATPYESYRQGYIDACRSHEVIAPPPVEPSSAPTLFEPVLLTDEPCAERLVAQSPLPSFQDFWNLYDLKLSRKPCEKVWNHLPLVDKLAIIHNIPKYFEYLKITGYSKKHPLTYLHQECWNDDYSSITAKPTPQDEESAYLQQQRDYISRLED